MGNGSVRSAFDFISYKIDSIKFSMGRELALLAFAGDYKDMAFSHTIHMRQPVYYTGVKQYLCGLDNTIELKRKAKRKGNKPLFTLKIGIAGLFSVEEGRLEQEIEKKLVMVQLPAILFPYVRASIAAILATAGFGSVILPLINVQKLAEEYSKKAEFSIKEIS